MRRWALCFLVMGAFACGDDAGDGDEPTLGELLSDRVRFKIGMLVDEALPEPTDGTVNLIELGPVSLLEPGGVEILAFDVEDPEGREVTVALLEFEDSGSHLETEVDAEDGVVETELITDDSLCEGLCAGVITAQAKIAVMLGEDDDISAAVTVEIAIDCRDHGDPEACDDEGGNGAIEDELICDDITDGHPALTGEESLDAYFDAVRTLALASQLTQEDASDAQSELSDALEHAGDASDLASALQERIDAATEGGLVVVLAERGCAVRASRVLQALRACDPGDVDSSQETGIQCTGVCEDDMTCQAADSAACRGVLQDAECDGTCTGACQAPLDEPSVCEGTCFGSCSGECTNEDGDECAGACAGNCDGECRQLSDGECAGSCTGLCDGPVPNVSEIACDEPLTLYCPSDAGSAVCRGDCFGEVDVDYDFDLCRASAVASGQAAARCEAPIVQLLFAFAPGLSSDEQASFAALVDDADEPIATLIALGARVDLLLAAAMELQAAEESLTARIGAVEDELSDATLTCIESTRNDAYDWLRDEIEVLEELRAQIIALQATLTESAL